MINLSARVPLPLYPYQSGKSDFNLSYKRNSAPNTNYETLNDSQNVDETFEKRKKKRTILKNTHMFPADFFNQNSETSKCQTRQRWESTDLEITKIQKSSSETGITKEITRVLGPVFPTLKFLERINAVDSENLPHNSYRLLGEDNQVLSNSKEIFPVKHSKIIRSQSLNEYSDLQKAFPIDKDPKEKTIYQQNDLEFLTSTLQLDSERKPIVEMKKRIYDVKPINHPEVPSLCLQNSFAAYSFKKVNMSNYRDPENKDNNSLSTDTSARLLRREIKNPRIEYIRSNGDYFSKNKFSEKYSNNLPLLTHKIEAMQPKHHNPFSVYYQEPCIQSDRQLNSFLPSAGNNLSGLTARVQSQEDETKPLKRKGTQPLTQFLLQHEKKKVKHRVTENFNKNSVTRVHSSIIRSIDYHLEKSNMETENLLHKSKSRARKQDIIENSQAIKSERSSTKESIEKNKNNTLLVPEESKEIQEFSFSQNFYKEPGSPECNSDISQIGKVKENKNHTKIVKLLNVYGQKHLIKQKPSENKPQVINS